MGKISVADGGEGQVEDGKAWDGRTDMQPRGAQGRDAGKAAFGRSIDPEKMCAQF